MLRLYTGYRYNCICPGLESSGGKFSAVARTAYPSGGRAFRESKWQRRTKPGGRPGAEEGSVGRTKGMVLWWPQGARRLSPLYQATTLSLLTQHQPQDSHLSQDLPFMCLASGLWSQGIIPKASVTILLPMGNPLRHGSVFKLKPTQSSWCHGKPY
jgi:hypothetical protein